MNTSQGCFFVIKRKKLMNPGLAPNVQSGMDGGIPMLSQTAPGAPMQSPAPQMPTPSQAAQPIPGTPSPDMGLSTENQMILKALIEKLKFNQKTGQNMGGGMPSSYQIPNMY
jgi:hypothetical protein